VSHTVHGGGHPYILPAPTGSTEVHGIGSVECHRNREKAEEVRGAIMPQAEVGIIWEHSAPARGSMVEVRQAVLVEIPKNRLEKCERVGEGEGKGCVWVSLIEGAGRELVKEAVVVEWIVVVGEIMIMTLGAMVSARLAVGTWWRPYAVRIVELRAK
jgi:hypothetical protein